ncbi:MAG: VWA domain-containing protein [Anaerolineaceae bacterium]|nr:VWA domain-containing protein [Anaerolineaceae bacterium]MCB9098565.1 VWA domain-containing protein [Anaerolineales bacterium]
MSKRHRLAIARLGSPELIARLSASVNWRGRRWQSRLWFIALIFVVLALARPRWGSQVEYIERRGVEVMVALDVSESMLAEDFKPNRLARAKLEISELMDRLEGNELGLVLFSGAAFVQFPLTSDFATARTFLDAAYPGIISRPGTDIAEAIQVAINGFNEERATQKVIIILTDGENHRTDVLGAAQTAADQGIIIYTVGFGSPDGEPIPQYDHLGNLIEYKKDSSGQTVLTRLDETTLQEIAAITNGAYFRAAPNGREVDLLADEIGRLQTSELESRFETRGIERFQWFLGIAVMALIIHELIPDRAWARAVRTPSEGLSDSRVKQPT